MVVMQMSNAICRALSVAVCAFMTAITPASSNPVLPAPETPVASGRVTINPADFEAWSDKLFGQALNDHQFSGLAVAVVQNGQLIFSKGYGYADAVSKKPMDPALTEVRIGSVTKVFTATAIAQLLERGKIASLDDPANKYLKRVQLPQAFGQDITLWHLLTHTAGFEDKAYGMANDKTPQVPVSSEDIKRYMPAIVRAPGSMAVYSNYSTALLGIIIEDVSGQTVQDFFADNILKPLGMTKSRLSYDITPSPNLGQPYAFFPNGEPQAVHYVGVHPLIAPAGSMTTTAHDMSKFMMANLAAGTATDNPILSPETYALLHGRKMGNNPSVTGFGMKFINGEWNGEKYFGHGGGWPGFQTVMEMFPDSNVGVFISIMGGDPLIGLGEQLRSLVAKTRLAPNADISVKRSMQLTDARSMLFKHLLGDYNRPALVDPVDSTPFLGTYWRERRTFTTIEAFFQLLSAGTSVLTVEPGAQGGLKMNGVDGYVAVGPNDFLKPGYGPTLDGDPNAVELFAFNRDTAAPQHARSAAPLLSVDLWTRTSDFWNPKVISQAIVLLFLGSLTGILAIFWPKKDQGGGPNNQARVAKWLPVLFSLAILAIPLSLMAGYADGDGLMYALLLGQPTRFIVMILSANVAAVIALAMVIYTVLGWRNKLWGHGGRAVARRIHFSLLTMIAVAIIPCLAFVNLIGVNLP